MTFFFPSCNDAPVANDDSASTTYQTAVVINVLANDTDRDGDTLTIYGTPTATNGSVTVNSDGTLTFTPDDGFSGTAEIEYTITDGHGHTASATATITVEPPVLDGIVEGTAGDDLIDYSYTGDPQGDMVDHNDAILPHTTTQDDIILAGDGNDTVYAGAGNDSVEAGNGDDLVYGQGGDDTLQGDAGNDTLYGDNGGVASGPVAAPVEQTVDWGDFHTDCGKIVDQTVDLGDTKVAFDFQALDCGATASYTSTAEYVAGTDADPNSGLRLYGLGGEGGVDPTSMTTLSFSSDNPDYTGEVQNVSFRINDVDTGNTCDDHIDIVTLQALGADGKPVAITITPSGTQTVDYDASTGTYTITGTTSDTGSLGPDDAIGSVLVEIADPTAKISIGYSNGANTDQAIEITDISLETVPVNTDTGAPGNDLLQGGLGDDVLYGEAGNDTLEGGDGADTLQGGEGDDSLLGGDGNDLEKGGAGNDTLYGEAGNDELYGGDGNDSLSGGEGDDTLHGGAGNDTLDAGQDGDELYGDEGDDLLLGGPREDLLNGGAGNDTILGGNAADSVEGGDGNDYVEGNDGNDTIDGGAGNDTLYGDAGDDVINGGAGDDSLSGGEGDDTLHGGAGNDTLDAGQDGDELYGDEGDDLLLGGPREDLLNGGAGNDTILGGNAADVIFGGAGNDSAEGNDGNDTFTGGEGADTMIGGADRDTFLVGGVGQGDGDSIDGSETGDDYDTLDLTGAGPVRIDSTQTDFDPVTGVGTYAGTVSFLDGSGNTVGTLQFENIENIVTDGDGIVEGTDGNDLIDYNYTGDPEGDMIDHGDAILPHVTVNDDIVEAGAGDDTIMAGEGNDSVRGGDGNDVEHGGTGNDTLYGEAGNDELFGDAGDDSLSGGEGDDTLHGGDGNDTLDAGQDNDVLYGDAGDDVLLGGPREDTLDGGTGNDTLLGGNAADSMIGGDGNDYAEGNDGNDYIDTSSATQSPDLAFPTAFGWPADADPNDDKDTVLGGAGNDTILTGDDADSVDGGAGDDVIDSGVDADTVDGGDGNDLITSGEGSDLVSGGAGDDTIYGGLGPSYPDAINIPDMYDPVIENGQDTIDGGDGNDVIYGEDDADSITGGAGNDYVDGGIDNDTLDGGAGNDTMVGGEGADSVYGGDDRDLFVVGSYEDGNGDTLDGGEGGDDYDTLDLRGAGPLRVDSHVTDYDPVSGVSTYAGTVTYLDGTGGTIGTMEFSNMESVIPCFTPGTLIATPKGEVPAESLKVGDRVLTRDNGIQVIRWAGRADMTREQLQAAPHLAPVLIKAGALGNGLPERDMLVSPNHRMLVANDKTALYFEEHEVLVAAKHLVGNDGISKAQTLGTSYLHFMFDRHEVVLGNGAWTESFQPGDQTLGGMGNAQRQEIFEIFPELRDAAGREAYGAARKTLKKHEASVLLRG